jgi:hypothetical protein
MNTITRHVSQLSNYRIIKLSNSSYAYSETGHHQFGGVIPGHVSFFFNYSLKDQGVTGNEYCCVERQFAYHGD